MANQPMEGRKPNLKAGSGQKAMKPQKKFDPVDESSLFIPEADISHVR
jgi:hypothetical protein